MKIKKEHYSDYLHESEWVLNTYGDSLNVIPPICAEMIVGYHSIDSEDIGELIRVSANEIMKKMIHLNRKFNLYILVGYMLPINASKALYSKRIWDFFTSKINIENFQLKKQVRLPLAGRICCFGLAEFGEDHYLDALEMLSRYPNQCIVFASASSFTVNQPSQIEDFINEVFCSTTNKMIHIDFKSLFYKASTGKFAFIRFVNFSDGIEVGLIYSDERERKYF